METQVKISPVIIGYPVIDPVAQRLMEGWDYISQDGHWCQGLLQMGERFCAFGIVTKGKGELAEGIDRMAAERLREIANYWTSSRAVISSYSITVINDKWGIDAVEQLFAYAIGVTK